MRLSKLLAIVESHTPYEIVDAHRSDVIHTTTISLGTRNKADELLRCSFTLSERELADARWPENIIKYHTRDASELLRRKLAES